MGEKLLTSMPWWNNLASQVFHDGKEVDKIEGCQLSTLISLHNCGPKYVHTLSEPHMWPSKYQEIDKIGWTLIVEKQLMFFKKTRKMN